MDAAPSLLDSLRPLVVLVTLVSVLGAGAMLRRGFRGDRPMVAVLAALGALSVGALALGERAPWLPACVVLAGFALAAVPASLHHAALVARIRGRWRPAARLARAAALAQPTARNRALARTAAVVDRVWSGALDAAAGVAALRALPEVPLLTTQVALLEGFAACRRAAGAAVLAGAYDPATLDELGRPHLAGYAAHLVAALCEAGRFDDAADVLGAMEARARDDAGKKRQIPEECDAFHNRARMALLAHGGEADALAAALRRTSPLRVLVTARDAAALLARAREAPAPRAREHARGVVREAAAALAIERRLANGFSHLRAPAPVTAAFMAANVLAFALAARAGDMLDPDHLLWVGGCHRALVEGSDAWRLVSSAFLHGGAVHLAINVLVGMEFGDIAERFLGPARLAAVYLAAALAGSLAHVLFGQEAVMVGASGAIFGVFGAALAVVGAHRAQVPARWYARQRVRLVSAAVLNLYLGVTVKVVSGSAHAGGFVAGFALAALLLAVERRALPGAPRAWRARAGRVGAGVVAALWVAAGAWAVRGVARSHARPLAAWIPLATTDVTLTDGGGRAVVRVAHPVTWQVAPRPPADNARVGPWIVGPTAQFVSASVYCGVQTAPAEWREPAAREGTYVVVQAPRPRGELALRYYFERGAEGAAGVLVPRLVAATTLVTCR